jgi:hypothetical protein
LLRWRRTRSRSFIMFPSLLCKNVGPSCNFFFYFWTSL